MRAFRFPPLLSQVRSSRRLAFCLALAALGFSLNAFADLNQTVSDLIPGLASSDAHARYAPEMELQRIALEASKPGAETSRGALAKVLAAKASDSDVPQPARVWLVRQLEYIGAEESVPALTALLRDPDAQLRECARRALEKNSAPEATESLRAALAAGGDARWTIGLIQSLGQRRDARSVELISRSLQDPQIAFAACSALARIASDSAIESLWGAFEKQIPPASDALASAANHLSRDGHQTQAAAIYSKLLQSTQAAPLRSAALIGLAKAAPAESKKLIAETLASGDSRLQSAAVSAARVVYGSDTSAALAPQVSSLDDSAKIAVMRVLDRSAEGRLIALAKTGSEPVRVAALERLGSVGDAEAATVLLETAAEQSSPPQQAATAALGLISGDGAGEAIAKSASQGETGVRVAAIRALARRSARSSIPSLFKFAAESDDAISKAAWDALAELGGDAELERVAKLALTPSAPEAANALHTIATRAQDKNADADKLVALLDGADAKQSGIVFETLAVLGGDTALKPVAAATSSDNDAVKDAAVRALASWPDFEAVHPLLAVASAPNAPPVYSVLALQGVARLVKSSDQTPVDQRLKVATAAMQAATRLDEKRLLLSAFAAIPDAKSAQTIRACLKEPDLKTEAGLAGVNLARTLMRRDRTAARNLAQAIIEAHVSDDITRRAEAMLSGRRR